MKRNWLKRNVYVRVNQPQRLDMGIFLLTFLGFMIYSAVKGRRINAFENSGLTEGLRSQAGLGIRSA